MKNFPQWGQVLVGVLIVVTVLSGSLPFLQATTAFPGGTSSSGSGNQDLMDFLGAFIGGISSKSKSSSSSGKGPTQKVTVADKENDSAAKRALRLKKEEAGKAEREQQRSNSESANARRQTAATSVVQEDTATRVKKAGDAAAQSATEKALKQITDAAQKKAASSGIIGDYMKLAIGPLVIDSARQRAELDKRTEIAAFGSYESSARDPVSKKISKDPIATPENAKETALTLARPESTDIQRQSSDTGGVGKRFKDGILSQLLGSANRLTSQATGGKFGSGGFSGGAQGIMSGIIGKISGGNSDFGSFLSAFTQGRSGGSGGSGGFWDPLQGIISGKLNDLLSGIGSHSGGGGSIGNGIDNPTIFPNNQVILATQFSTSAGDAVNANVVRPIFEPVGIANILNEFSDCPDPNRPGPTNCVIDENFLTAVQDGVTVRQAIEKGLLKRDAVFGFRSDGLEPNYREGYPYRSLVILRTYRVVPIGWELAAQYIKAHDTKTLGEVLDGFSVQASPFLGLVDPNWVLVSPEIFCRRSGPGPNFVQDDITDGIDSNGNGDFSDPGDTPPARSIMRSQEYCADPQTCLVKGADGQCKYFGYCSQERRIWQLNGQACDPVFNTCQTYLSSSGEEVNYLKNTLDFDSCVSPKSIGCQAISIPDNKKVRLIDEVWKGSQAIYFNRNTLSCDVEHIGCSQYLSPRRNDQPLQNDGSRTVTTPEKDATILGEVNWLITQAQEKDRSGLGSYESVGQGYSTKALYLKDNANLRCNANAVGCDRYTPTQKGDDLVVPAVVGIADQCNGACVGLDRYRQMPTAFEATYAGNNASDLSALQVNTREAIDMIPDKGEECAADQVGCDEFTNVDEIARGGEIKEYFSGIRYCQKSHDDSAVYLIEHDTGITGYQITSHELKLFTSAAGTPPCTAVNGSGVCTASASCTLGSTPDCREFIGLDHKKYTALFSQTIAVSDQCHPYRRTKLAALSKEIQAKDCERTKGKWNEESGCTYNLLNTDSPTCKPLAASCREYQASSSGNLRILLDERFDDDDARTRWSGEGTTWTWLTNGTLNKGAMMQLRNTTSLSLLRDTTVPPTLSIPFEKDKQYMVSFWAQAPVATVASSAKSGSQKLAMHLPKWLNTVHAAKPVAVVSSPIVLAIEVKDDDHTYVFSDHASEIGTTWREYRLGPLTISQALDLTKHPVVVLSPQGGGGEKPPTIFIDNLRIQQSNLFLKSGSWSGKLPTACLAGVETVCGPSDPANAACAIDDAKDALGHGIGDPKQVGCRQYESEHSQQRVALKSFTNLCKEEFVGCQAMIDTHNSTSPNIRVPLGDEPSTTSVAADEVAYIIDNPKNYCPQEAKGCIDAGLQLVNDRTTVITGYRDGSVLNDPDAYAQTLCSEEQLGCKAFQNGATVSAFKDPGEAVCDYLIEPGQTSPRWYQRRSDPGDPYTYCETVTTKTIGSNGPIETPTALEVVSSGTTPATLQYLRPGEVMPSGYHRVSVSAEATKKVSWAGSCPVTTNSCTELIDSRSSISTGIVLNENFIQNLQSIADAANVVIPPVNTPPPVIPERQKPDGSMFCPKGTHLVLNRQEFRTSGETAPFSPARDVEAQEFEVILAHSTVHTFVDAQTFSTQPTDSIRSIYYFTCLRGEQTGDMRYGVYVPGTGLDCSQSGITGHLSDGVNVESFDNSGTSMGMARLSAACEYRKSLTDAPPPTPVRSVTTQRPCFGVPDLWNGVTGYGVVGNVCGVTAGSQDVKIEPNRLYVVELRGKGVLHATVGQCGPDSSSTTSAPTTSISMVSPDSSMEIGLDQGHKIEGHPQPFAEFNATTAQDKADNASTFEERIVTGRFIVHASGENPTTRGCVLTVSADSYIKNATIRPAGVYYAIENTLSNNVCNGSVNTDSGCVLMNKRGIVPANGVTNIITNGTFEDLTNTTSKKLQVPDAPRSKPAANGSVCPSGTHLGGITNFVSWNSDIHTWATPAAATDLHVNTSDQLLAADFTCLPGDTEDKRYGIFGVDQVHNCPTGSSDVQRTFTGPGGKSFSFTVCQYPQDGLIVDVTVGTPTGWDPKELANFSQKDGNRFAKQSVTQKVEQLLPGRYRLAAVGTTGTTGETAITIQCSKDKDNNDYTTIISAGKTCPDELKDGQRCKGVLVLTDPAVISGAYPSTTVRASFKTGNTIATTTKLGQIVGATLSSGNQVPFFFEFNILPAATPAVDCIVKATSPTFIDNVALIPVTNESLQGFEALKFDADRSGIDQLDRDITSNLATPFPCGDGESANSVCRSNSNYLVKAIPDRQCGAWLSCRSALETKDATGNTQNLCFDIARCTQFGQNGECTNFAVQDRAAEVVDSASIVKLRDEAGFTKVGRQWPPTYAAASNAGVHDVVDLGLSLTSKSLCVGGTRPGGECQLGIASPDAVCGAGGRCTAVKNYSDYGWFPVATMQQTGNVLRISNGGFEEVAGTMQPSSWKTEDPKPGAVFAPAWSKGYFQAVNNPLAIQKEGVQPHSGLSYMAIRGENRAVTSLILAFGNTDYVVSAAVNTSSLKPPAYGQVIIEQFDGKQHKITNAPLCGGPQPIPTPGQLRVEAGLDWKQLNYSFKTCPNAQYVQLKLAGLYNHIEQPVNDFLKAEGSTYFDDIQMTPVLNTTASSNITRSCRLYATADAPACRFQNSTGVRFRGLEGYCMQKDPNNAEICLQWYPVDIINGDERGESEIDYKGKSPLYYCTEMKVVETRLVTPAEVGRNITIRTGWLSGGGGSAGSLLAGKGTIVDVVNIIAAIFGPHKFTENFTSGECESEPKVNGYTTYQTHEQQGHLSFFGAFGRKKITIKTFCQASGDILFTSHDSANKPSNWYEYNGTQWSIASQTSGGEGFTEEIHAVCQKLAKVVQADGENFAWQARLTEGGLKFIPELGYAYGSDAEPFGAVTPPSVGDPDNPSTWQLDFPLPITTNTGVARGGNPFACSNDKQNGYPVCQISALHGVLLGTNESPRHYPTGGLEECSDASSRLKHLFAKEYGTWEWGGSCKPIQKICRNSIVASNSSVKYACDAGTSVGQACTVPMINHSNITTGECPYGNCVPTAQQFTGNAIACVEDSDCPQDPILCEKVMTPDAPVAGAGQACEGSSDPTCHQQEVAVTYNCAALQNTAYDAEYTACRERTALQYQYENRRVNNPDVICGSILGETALTPEAIQQRQVKYQACVAAGGQGYDTTYTPGPCQPSNQGSGVCQSPPGITYAFACQGGIRSGQSCDHAKGDKDCRGSGEKEGYVPLSVGDQCSKDWNIPSDQCPNNIRPTIDFAYCKEANDYYTMNHPQGAQTPEAFRNTFAGVCVGGYRDPDALRSTGITDDVGKCVTRHPACPKVSVFATQQEWTAARCPGDYPLINNENPGDFFGCPAAAMIGGVKGSINPSAELCAVAPMVKTMLVNKTNVGNSEFVNLKFTSLIDANQLPMTAYKIDWGDGETTTLSGVEIKDRPNIDNAHSLYHLYSYWDIIQKEGKSYFTGRFNSPSKCTGAACDANDPYREVTVKVQIRDKWGWCNGEKDYYDSTDTSNYGVAHHGQWCQGGLAWKSVSVDQKIKVFRDRRAPTPIAVVSVEPGAPGSTPRVTPLSSGAACPAGTHLTILRQATGVPAAINSGRTVLAEWDFESDKNTETVAPDKISSDSHNNGTVVGQAGIYNDNATASLYDGRLFNGNGRITTPLYINQRDSGMPLGSFGVVSKGVTMDVVIGGTAIPNGALVSTESAGATNSWGLTIQDGKIHIQTGLRNMDTGVPVSSSPLHIVGVFDPNGAGLQSNGSDAKVRLYVENRLLFSDSRLGYTYKEWPITIGNNHAGDNTFNDGVIRSVKIYLDPLTTAELGQAFPEASNTDPIAPATTPVNGHELMSIDVPLYTKATYFTCEVGEETGNFRFGVLPQNNACPSLSNRFDKEFTIASDSTKVTLKSCRFAK